MSQSSRRRRRRFAGASFLSHALLALAKNKLISMKEICDDWMMPRTKAGVDEMNKRVKLMRDILERRVNCPIFTIHPDHIINPSALGKASQYEAKHALEMFNSFFSFEWNNDLER
jgi:hypothetical protein